MNVDDLKDLIPKNKLETEKAEALVQLGYPAVLPVIGKMPDQARLTYHPFLKDYKDRLTDLDIAIEEELSRQ